MESEKEVIKRTIIESLKSATNCELASIYEIVVSCGNCPYWNDCKNEHDCFSYIIDKL